MRKTVRIVLMETDCESVLIPQALDGLSDVQDVMDAEYPWLDALVGSISFKYFKGTLKPETLIINDIEWDFRTFDYSQE
jgi:hypothetical protein